jgi:hypothetical protein
MKDKKGQVMSKDSFLSGGLYSKEQYEGLLVSSDMEQGCYNIGVQLGEDRVLVVDQAMESNVRERIQTWVPQVQDIQNKYNVKNDLENYSRY